MYSSLISRNRRLQKASYSRTLTTGYSLVELLVVIAVGGILMIAAVGLLTSHFRYTARLEAQNRLQDAWGRVNLLLSSEISEADTVTTDGTCDGTASSMTLNVRNANQSNTTASIRYAVNGTGFLVRCGPPVNLDGTLNFSGNEETSPIIRGATLNVTLPTARTPTYTLTLTDPATGTSYANQVSSIRSRVRIIDQ